MAIRGRGGRTPSQRAHAAEEEQRLGFANGNKNSFVCETVAWQMPIIWVE